MSSQILQNITTNALRVKNMTAIEKRKRYTLKWTFSRDYLAIKGENPTILSVFIWEKSTV